VVPELTPYRCDKFLPIHYYIGSMASPVNMERINEVLRGVIDPELGVDIVELGMVREIEIDEALVRVVLALTTAGCPLRAEIKREVVQRLGAQPGVDAVKIDWTTMTDVEKSAAMDTARRRASERPETTTIPERARVVLVGSGKGGVGKSSVTSNLAVAVARRGFRVGLIDADIWGYSIPRLLGIEGRLEADTTSKRILPRTLEVRPGRVDVVSMGFLTDDEESALMWRGLILQRAVRHFLEDVDWAADLDYVFVDLPPGTGDVQMGIATMLPRAEMLIVTTPSLNAQKVALRAVDMARKNYLHVLGVIENMSWFETPGGEVYEILGKGGAEDLSRRTGIPVLGAIPLEAAVAEGGDNGRPVALESGAAARAFSVLAERLVIEVCPPAKHRGLRAAPRRRNALGRGGGAAISSSALR
jgi:ATP-binding protein involved in chromosome partitioning